MKFQRAVLSAAAALLLSTGVFAEPPLTAEPQEIQVKAFASLAPSEQEAKAPEVLQAATGLTADLFAPDGVGIARVRSDRLLAYQAILRRSDAATVFRKLLQSSDPVTQLYALSGLYARAPVEFASLAPKYTKRQDTILIAHGCLVGIETFGRLVQNLQSSGSLFVQTPKRFDKQGHPLELSTTSASSRQP